MNCTGEKDIAAITSEVDLYRCEVWREIIRKMPVI